MSIIAIESDNYLSEEIFLKDVWNQFYHSMKRKENIILDFRNIRFIQSTVIPKLCCLGVIGKRNAIEVYLSTNQAIAEYLSEFDFWNIVYKHDIFKFDERNLDLYADRKKVTNAFFCLQKEELGKKYDGKFEFREYISKSTIYKYFVKADLVGERNIGDKGEYSYKTMSSQCQAVLRTMSNFLSYSKYTSEDKIIDSLVELVHNSVWHGEGVCFVMVQACTYKNKKGIEISVADTGMSLYNSFIQKEDFTPKCYEKEAFFEISDPQVQNYCSIIEALLYRKRSVTRGIYNILEDLANEPDDVRSELRIVNGNISLYLRKDNIKELVRGNIEKVLSEQKKYMRRKNDIGYSFSMDICMYEKRKGV